MRYLSYVRRGLARSIGEQADRAGVPRTAAATVDLAVVAAGQRIGRTLAVRGPGSVLALAAGEVVRVDPPDGAQNCPVGLFASAELRTADLPWMFTPARPRDDRLIPWLVLVVVEERDGVSLDAGVLTVDEPARELPDLHEAWAWAHVDVHSDYDDLATLLDETPELATARLLCPRLLAPDAGYIACLVPAFEAGRLAALGLPAAADSVDLAWTPDTGPVRLPALHSWHFRTATDPADFEELARRLAPAPLTSDVGVHGLDLSDPGSGRLPHDPVVVGYEGPLGSPNMQAPPWTKAERKPFQDALAGLLADVSSGGGRPPGASYDATRDDPVVGPPAYGTLPSGIDDVPAPGARPTRKAPRWLSEVNLDPRNRSAAGLGAEVVRRGQEALMADAWDQARGLGQVNRVLTRTRLALEVGKRGHARFVALPDGALLQASAGAHARLAGGIAGRTVRGRRADTAAPAGLFSAAFRRRTRAGGLLARAVAGGTDQAVVTGRITEAYGNEPDTMLAFTTLTLPQGLDATPVEPSLAGVLPAGRPDPPAPRSTGRVPSPMATRNPINNLRVGSVFGPLDRLVSGLGTGIAETGDLALSALAAIVRTQLEPTAVLSRRLRQTIEPAEALGDEPVPASLPAALDLPDPLYRRLVAIDPEVLMPGAGTLAPDSVGIAKVNQASVEAFLLGANHELARELLWREYPTPVGGTWLRQFWDATEPNGDIPPIEAWRPGPLGTHAIEGGDPDNMVVLVVKAELLRCYPRTLITAVPARRVGGVREEDPHGTPIDPTFTGTLGPDAVFLGFDFGEDAGDIAGDPGWYFAFEQPPTEPAFGLDIPASDGSPRLRLWKDLTWDDARVSPDDAYVGLDALGSITLPYDDRGENTWTETWAANAAAMARITLQRPVRMLVHADQMLTSPDG